MISPNHVFMLNSTERKIDPAYKCQNAKNVNNVTRR